MAKKLGAMQGRQPYRTVVFSLVVLGKVELHKVLHGQLFTSDCSQKRRHDEQIICIQG